MYSNTNHTYYKIHLTISYFIQSKAFMLFNLKNLFGTTEHLHDIVMYFKLSGVNSSIILDLQC